nr:MAG TPA: Avd-like protein [Caudoviricetes sp.]
MRAGSKDKKPGQLTVLAKAELLVDHTLTLTDNTNRYPKKVRFTFVNRMQNYALDIYMGLLMANELRLDVPGERAQRLQIQRQTMTNCKVLLAMIKMSYKQHYINDSSCEYWSKLVFDVLHMTAAWHKKDKER